MRTSSIDGVGDAEDAAGKARTLANKRFNTRQFRPDCEVEDMPVRLRVVCTLAFSLFAMAGVVNAKPQGTACKLPESLRNEIAVRYPGTDLVTPSALGMDDRVFFQKDHGDACPGLAKIDFYGDGKPTLAMVLVAKGKRKDKAKRVVAHLVAGEWQTVLMDSVDDTSVPVVWGQPPGKYRDVYGNKEIRSTRSVIVFTAYESWSILYVWTGSRVVKMWLMD